MLNKRNRTAFILLTATRSIMSQFHPNTGYPRVLSIQSTVSYGYVGNKAAIFPLQCLGFNVDAINTVSLSNHPDYSGGFKGQFLSAEDMQATLTGLKNNALLNQIDCVLTGYTRSIAVLEHVESTVKHIRENNQRAIYICDPVLGDNGSFYVPEELLDFYKTRLIPIAYAITPNYFETELLTGLSINTIDDAKRACDILHSLGPKVLLLKGLRLHADKENGPLSILLSYREDGRNLLLRVNVDRIRGSFSGCGDLFSALATAGLFRFREHLIPTSAITEPHEALPGRSAALTRVLGSVLEEISSALSNVVSATNAVHGRELRIVESLDLYLGIARVWGDSFSTQPSSSVRSAAYVQSSDHVAGVIFDMDGTLTEPGAINFSNMYTRNGLSRSDGDMIQQIERMTDPAKKQAAWDILHEEEMLGCERMSLRPKMNDVLDALRTARVRVALSTRNSRAGYEKFALMANLPDGSFSPCITRDCLNGLNKPDPRVAQHVLDKWQIPTSEAASTWFVGDSEDDVLCGKGAGMKTCLIKTTYNRDFAEKNPGVVDVQVETLEEFLSEIMGIRLHTESNNKHN